MPIFDYEILTQEIPLPTRGGAPKSFLVRALAFPDIEYLVRNHLGDLVKAVELYVQKKGGRMASSSLQEFALIVSRDLPALTAEIIAVTLEGEPEGVSQIDKIRKLPVLVQINALLAICQLTNEEAGGLKNLIAFVAPLLQGAVAGAESEPGTLKRKLLDTIGGFGKTSASSLPADDE